MSARALPAAAPLAEPANQHSAPVLRLQIDAAPDAAVMAALLARLGSGPRLFRGVVDGALSLTVELPDLSPRQAEPLALRLAKIAGIRRIAGEVVCPQRGVIAGVALKGRG
ncbi:MAG TPA: hypothetical protein VEH84_14480 [Alphaproteobacteria bacterium]|nr:hypothetical protein [Alphaproteobacteria bacterium]